jgi:hypothetical protein
LAFPAIIRARVLGADAPSSRITLGFIGAGVHGLGWNLDRIAELVRNGRIGKLQTIRVTLPGKSVNPEPPKPAPAPKGFDIGHAGFPA